MFNKISTISRLKTVIQQFSTRKMVNGAVETSIKEKIQKALTVDHLNVINESHMHNVPPNSETHFKIIVVSKDFEGVSLIERHRIVNRILEDELKTGVHALSIQSKTPEQWKASCGHISESPKCLGGMKKENEKK